ncbi:TraR/DksA C4-type zinc finger protein [Sporosarcina sp. CAU 1771]
MDTEKQLLLKNMLLDMKKQLIKTEQETDITTSAQETSGELSMYANHPGDLGTELFDREKNMAINVHVNSELEKINNALSSIEVGKYGECETCGVTIPFERLEAIPYTTVCIEHSTEHKANADRPVEEAVLKPSYANSFSKNQDGAIKDYQDSFKEAAQDGTSETPSDFMGDHDNYQTLYDNQTDGETKEILESLIDNGITGRGIDGIESVELD